MPQMLPCSAYWISGLRIWQRLSGLCYHLLIREGLDSGLNFFYCHKKNWSQGDLTQQIGASREIIGKYERNENLPSIEMVAKMARAFGVTVEFLIGEGENASYDKETVDRINNIQKMDEGTKNVLFNVIDTYIQNFKTKQAFAAGL
ncbi:helix-turn-helix domain-containing protein [Belliella kenyensis]|uniref:Helix-turn-helix domain-containing protein n=1 Tax=Belliella kenyensis TaxID=1472724 RepID=A0ABV8EM81_9BACT|nr:helix-turn-helix transcriptional regulator [Belliella kenyensis]MCH7403884.1 helix-turn-helix transcriptional regulator [Belliella kenyensis]MDN3604886.1 helix-turn-helix transcriptional regulator [Belliella kenyensis]